MENWKHLRQFYLENCHKVRGKVDNAARKRFLLDGTFSLTEKLAFMEKVIFNSPLALFGVP